MAAADGDGSQVIAAAVKFNALGEYRAKRNFRRTPEPAGRLQRPKARRLQYCRAEARCESPAL
jgi:hypothetical protein